VSSLAALTKVRLSSFVVLSAVAGTAAVPASLQAEPVAATIAGVSPSLSPIVAALPLAASYVGLCGTVAAANAGNQLIERRHDAGMARTARRPLVTGALSVPQVASFIALSGIGGVAVMGLTTNWTAGLLAGANILLYTLAYTPAKRIHWLNTWIGALVGALPPLIGWAMVSPDTVWTAPPLVLAAALYIWQIPHFLAIAWSQRAAYASAGYAMMSRTAPAAVGPNIFLWSLYMVPLVVVVPAVGLTSWWFALTMLPFSLHTALAARQFVRSHPPTPAVTRSVFRSTLYWLPAFVLLLIVHKKTEKKEEEEKTTKEAGGAPPAAAV
jgi:protoheme IX farnesyltransferase